MANYGLLSKLGAESLPKCRKFIDLTPMCISGKHKLEYQNINQPPNHKSIQGSDVFVLHNRFYHRFFIRLEILGYGIDWHIKMRNIVFIFQNSHGIK